MLLLATDKDISKLSLSLSRTVYSSVWTWSLFISGAYLSVFASAMIRKDRKSVMSLRESASRWPSNLYFSLPADNHKVISSFFVIISLEKNIKLSDFVCFSTTFMGRFRCVKSVVRRRCFLSTNSHFAKASCFGAPQPYFRT